jgi:peptide/nickel transport system substrate-binding protein
VSAVQDGDVTAAFVRDPLSIRAAKDAQLMPLDMAFFASDVVHMNVGSEMVCNEAMVSVAPACQNRAVGTRVRPTTATSDPRIRKAVQLAVDPKVVYEAVYHGAAKADASPFSNSAWDPHLPAPTIDLDQARRLVIEAKIDGWDGKVRLAAGNDATGSREWVDAVASQLTAVGMIVTKQLDQTSQGVADRIFTRHDYDLVKYTYGFSDEYDNNYVLLAMFFNGNMFGYGPPDMIAAADSLRMADTDAARTNAYKGIAEILVRDAPGKVLAGATQSLVFTPKLKGLIRTGSQTILFERASLDS